MQLNPDVLDELFQALHEHSELHTGDPERLPFVSPHGVETAGRAALATRCV